MTPEQQKLLQSPTDIEIAELCRLADMFSPIMKLTARRLAFQREYLLNNINGPGGFKEYEKTSKMLILAAHYLLMAATGPKDGPTSWNQTMREWMEKAKPFVESIKQELEL